MRHPQRLAASLAFLATLLGASAGGAQGLDVIRGKVTEAGGKPVPNARVTATSIPGGLTKETRTDSKGSFQLSFQNGEGDYMMGFSVLGFAYKSFEVKRTADQDFLLADARLLPVMLDTLKVTAPPAQQRVDRYMSAPDVSGTDRAVNTAALPPDAAGSVAALAATVAGVLLLPGSDGGADGFSVLGMGADQNSVTLNGVQFDANGFPRDANMGGSLTTSSADVGRGGFSGGQLNLRSAGSSSYRTRGINMQINAPQLQWTDRAGRALGSKTTNVSIGGKIAAPVTVNTSYYDISWQIGRRQNALQTLLNTDAIGLRTQGIATDSVARLMDILGGAGIAASAGGVGNSQYSDNASLLGTFNYAPFASATSQSFTGTASVNGSWAHPTGSGLRTVPSYASERTNYGGSLQGSHSGYLGMTLSETSAGLSFSESYGSPYLDLPSGRVRVSSTFEDGADGVSSLSFGGNPSASSRSSSKSFSINNALSRFSDDNKHRLRLTTELAYDRSEQDQSSNLLGSFTFNSLEDLEAGRPASFTRQLTARVRRTGGIGGAVSLGDTYRHSADLQLQYGVRLDGNVFAARPEFNPLVESEFNVRNDHAPQRVYVSPRVSFSWTLGEAAQIAAFDGAVRGPRAIVRGGIGVYQNRLGSSAIANALDNTGLPSGVQQLVCTGPAAPIPDWDAFAADPASIPRACADGTGGTVFSSTNPNVSLFASDFAAQRRISANLSWSGRVLWNRFSTTIDGTAALLTNQQRSVDLNFRDEQRFALADEAGRPVFVEPTSIVASTGAIGTGDARVSQSFNRVMETRSDLRGTTGQVTVSLSPVYTTVRRFTWNGSYAFSMTREQVPGFSSTVGNPLAVEWASSGAPLHRFNYALTYRVPGYVSLTWNGSLLSGRSFTPMIAGDVNGDGSSNDRAFLFDPDQTADPALATAMRELLDNTSGRVGDCLRRQIGAFAERNSCVAPWTTSASMSIAIDPAKSRLPRRARVTFNLSNPMGAADLALNGSGGLKGWGQSPSPDPSLLYVRGFDAATQRYRYEVNKRFGVVRPALTTLRSPVNLTVNVRMDLGAAREAQMLRQRLDNGRRTPGTKYPATTLRSMIGTQGIVNPILNIISQQDLLGLTPSQADSLAAMSRRYAYRADSIMVPTMNQLAALPDDYDASEAEASWFKARIAVFDLLQRMAPAINSLLTPEQRRKLPQNTLNYLDPLYLSLAAKGTSTYSGMSFIR
jgi:hypothetical protein